jgi:zinc carboxypeptidase
MRLTSFGTGIRGWIAGLVLLPSVAGAAPPRPSSPNQARTPEAPPYPTLPSPEAYFGHIPGADRTVIAYDELIAYLQILADRSDRVSLFRIGKTTQGRDFVMVAISTPENLAQAAHYREIAAKLDDPRGLAPQEIDRLVAEGKVILFVTLNIHSDEIAVSQMSPEWIYRLATGGDDSPARYLKDVIVVLVPSMNPDGQMMIADWYRKYVGTPYEGSELPWLYHPYAGHDNNRDWFMLNLVETRLVNHAMYQEWHPQVLLDEHQMGGNGPRLFVPPYADPVSENVPPLVHRGAMLFGAEMAMALEEAGKSGVIYGYSFDAYWPGGNRSTPCWKNTIGLLTETASARVMTPLFIPPEKLEGGQKGLPEYRVQANFPHPWPGGWWHPRDIVEYALLLTTSALESCSLHREELLRNRATMALDAVHRGKTEAPYAYVIPAGQHDPGTAEKLADLLRENGVEVRENVKALQAGSTVIPPGSFLVYTAQPYRAFIREMMEPETYPEIKAAPNSKDILAPYDVTAWTLPYLMGVQVIRCDTAVVGESEQVIGFSSAPEWAPTDEATYFLYPSNNDAYTAVARLLSAGKTVRQLQVRVKASPEIPAREPGTFLVRANRNEMLRAMGDLHLDIRPPYGSAAFEDWLRSAHIPVRTLHLPRVGLYQSWLAPTDEGWTRFVLDQFGFPYTTLHNRDIQSGGLRSRFDAIVLPDQTRDEIVNGTAREQSAPTVPGFSGGLGETGVRALREFVRAGGTLVALGDAVQFGIQDLHAPVKNVTERVPREDFRTPGTLLRVTVNLGHSLAFGMPPDAMVYHTSDPVLATLPGWGSGTAVIARYVDASRVVASGWARGASLLENKAALVETSSGKGKIVLFAFRPQYRGQTHATYRLLFNALLDAAAR